MCRTLPRSFLITVIFLEKKNKMLKFENCSKKTEKKFNLAKSFILLGINCRTRPFPETFMFLHMLFL